MLLIKLEGGPHISAVNIVCFIIDQIIVKLSDSYLFQSKITLGLGHEFIDYFAPMCHS
jgi:hypothetical protein